MKIIRFLFFAGIAVFTFQSCYYDKEDQIYLLNNAPCDTATVSYLQQVVPILTNNCYACHSGTAAAGAGIKLDVHASLAVYANNGILLKAITHSPGASPMPKNGTKLVECNIAKIRTWVRNGAPNN